MPPRRIHSARSVGDSSVVDFCRRTGRLPPALSRHPADAAVHANRPSCLQMPEDEFDESPVPLVDQPNPRVSAAITGGAGRSVSPASPTTSFPIFPPARSAAGVTVEAPLSVRPPRPPASAATTQRDNNTHEDHPGRPLPLTARPGTGTTILRGSSGGSHRSVARSTALVNEALQRAIVRNEAKEAEQASRASSAKRTASGGVRIRTPMHVPEEVRLMHQASAEALNTLQGRLENIQQSYIFKASHQLSSDEGYWSPAERERREREQREKEIAAKKERLKEAKKAVSGGIGASSGGDFLGETVSSFHQGASRPARGPLTARRTASDRMASGSLGMGVHREVKERIIHLKAVCDMEEELFLDAAKDAYQRRCKDAEKRARLQQHLPKPPSKDRSKKQEHRPEVSPLLRIPVTPLQPEALAVAASSVTFLTAGAAELGPSPLTTTRRCSPQSQIESPRIKTELKTFTPAIAEQTPAAAALSTTDVAAVMGVSDAIAEFGDSFIPVLPSPQPYYFANEAKDKAPHCRRGLHSTPGLSVPPFFLTVDTKSQPGKFLVDEGKRGAAGVLVPPGTTLYGLGRHHGDEEEESRGSFEVPSSPTNKQLEHLVAPVPIPTVEKTVLAPVPPVSTVAAAPTSTKQSGQLPFGAFGYASPVAELQGTVRERRLQIARQAANKIREDVAERQRLQTTSGANANVVAKQFAVWIHTIRSGYLFARAIVRTWPPFDDERRQTAMFHPPHGAARLIELARAATLISRHLFRFRMRRAVRKRHAAVKIISTYLRLLVSKMKISWAVHRYLSKLRQIQKAYRVHRRHRMARIGLWMQQWKNVEPRIIDLIRLRRDTDIKATIYSNEVRTLVQNTPGPVLTHSALAFLKKLAGPGRVKLRQLEELEEDALLVQGAEPFEKLPTLRHTSGLQIELILKEHLATCEAHYLVEWRAFLREKQAFTERVELLTDAIGVEKANDRLRVARIAYDAGDVRGMSEWIPPKQPLMPTLLPRATLFGLMLRVQRDAAKATALTGSEATAATRLTDEKEDPPMGYEAMLSFVNLLCGRDQPIQSLSASAMSPASRRKSAIAWSNSVSSPEGNLAASGKAASSVGGGGGAGTPSGSSSPEVKPPTNLASPPSFYGGGGTIASGNRRKSRFASPPSSNSLRKDAAVAGGGGGGGAVAGDLVTFASLTSLPSFNLTTPPRLAPR